ncbi:MAG: small conductance mechanosensitive channel [Thermoproteota archaeon]|nr:small conductance mechanosensitive channel [Thermoproteota archaeon]
MVRNITFSLQDLFPQMDLVIALRIILTIAFSIILYKILSSIISKTSKRIKIQPELIREIINFLRIVIGGLTFISILGSLGIDITGLIAGVGIGALAVGFAAQALISNLISGLFLIFERTFTIGDVIRVDDTVGKIVHIGFRATQIESVEGNIVVIPNSSLASSQIVNMTSKRNEMMMVLEETVDIYSNVERTKQLLLEAAIETKGTIVDEEHVPSIIIERRPSQWQLVLKLLVTVEASRWYMIKSDITEAIKKKFDSEVILPPAPAAGRDQLNAIKQALQNSQVKT